MMEYKNLDMAFDGLRKDYQSKILSLEEMPDNPLDQFAEWFEEAVAANYPIPNAFVLATSSGNGAPSS